jgi:hypothetical protein
MWSMPTRAGTGQCAERSIPPIQIRNHPGTRNTPYRELHAAVLGLRTKAIQTQYATNEMEKPTNQA